MLRKTVSLEGPSSPVPISMGCCVLLCCPSPVLSQITTILSLKLANGRSTVNRGHEHHRSCPSSVRVNTRGLSGERQKDKKVYMRGSSGHPSGPRTPGGTLVAGRADARRLHWLPPRAASHPSACSHPHWLWPRRHPIQQDLSQAPDMIGQPGGHRWRIGAPVLRGARALGGQGLGEGLV
jgi:hypothetical protein